MLTNKYKPESYKEVFGQDLIIRAVVNWLDRWKQGEALLIYGPTGVGKTLITNVLAKEKKMHLLEVNPSDPRNAEALGRLKKSLQQKTIFGSKIVLIDEIDVLLTEDNECVTEMMKVIDESKYPIILTANNPFERRLKPLREKCRLLKMRGIPVNIIFNRLKQISYKEGFKISDEILRKISVKSRGDMRSAINDLEVAVTGNTDIESREKEIDIFNLLRLIFKTRDIKRISEAIENSDKGLDELILWVENNIANEYEKPEEIAEAFEILSKADLYRSKVFRNQNYRFEKYAKDMIAAISSVKRKTYNKFTPYKYPNRIIILGQSKEYRMEMNEIIEKFAKELHCSKRRVRTQLPYLEKITGFKVGM